jgi:putative endonuclease
VAKFIATFMYYLYLLKSLKDKKLYIGFTSKLSRRLREHNAGEVFSTKGRRPLELIYCEVYKSLTDARRRERNLKLFSTAYNGLKARLIDSL